jgi:hypothetical protein
MENKKRLTKILIIVLFSLTILSSCWVKKEINSNTQWAWVVESAVNEIANKGSEVKIWVEGWFSINE